MTDDSLTLAEEVNAAPWWVLNSCLYPTFFSPTLRFLAPYPPPPSPWGNMAFEVNTICFVAFLWWLNNGLKYVAKWESQVEDGSNLAFFSEWWHRPIEINERAGILTLSLLQEKQQPLGSVLFTQFTGPALLKYNGINFAQVLIKKNQKRTDDIVGRILGILGPPSWPYHRLFPVLPPAKSSFHVSCKISAG